MKASVRSNADLSSFLSQPIANNSPPVSGRLEIPAHNRLGSLRPLVYRMFSEVNSRVNGARRILPPLTASGSLRPPARPRQRALAYNLQPSFGAYDSHKRRGLFGLLAVVEGSSFLGWVGLTGHLAHYWTRPRPVRLGDSLRRRGRDSFRRAGRPPPCSPVHHCNVWWTLTKPSSVVPHPPV